ncbi:sensor histidine kinase [Sphingomonas sp. NIBR02145]|uniref:sensor histidine kinase n=1 Tax=Sphingomonas sp. NIBR02145 TaxID=3014784 RepID=UPI0022B5B1DF|nr:sensor histidine kinase [Sphingomonas sp. NIBR02145]WHU04879.1 sensor histidine kinase [Sphingomonas sp. NIBR02145]
MLDMANTVADTGTTIEILPAARVSDADEMNHRIANSLQLLSAMVSVEARGIADPVAQAALDVTQRRIAAVASVHRQLYQAHESTSVDLRAYLESLAADLQAGATGRPVLVDAAAVSVRSEDATAIGIIVSELVTNAFKYAYAPGAPGNVRVMLRSLPLGGYMIEVSDRGRGRVAEVIQGSGFGSRLIELMAARLGAEGSYRDAQPGTRFLLFVGGR